MNQTIRSGLLLFVLCLLSACGGNDAATSSNHAAVMLAPRALASAPVASDYSNAVQQIYVAYFGRPADAGGLTYYEGLLLNAGAPTDLVSLSQAYSGNAVLKSIIDSFGNSAESAALYPGDNGTFVLAVYNNLFNRVADDAGKAYWANLIDTGAITRGNAAISIMAGSQGNDLTIINNKTLVASDFTAMLTTQPEMQAYSGLTAAATVRSMLANVSFDTDVAAFRATVSSTLASLTAASSADTYAQVAIIIQNRCVQCHSVNPTMRVSGFGSPPDGYAFDTSAEIHANAQLINAEVASGAMPYGNQTGMTSDERAVIAAWFSAGAP